MFKGPCYAPFKLTWFLPQNEREDQAQSDTMLHQFHSPALTCLFDCLTLKLLMSYCKPRPQIVFAPPTYCLYRPPDKKLILPQLTVAVLEATLITTVGLFNSPELLHNYWVDIQAKFGDTVSYSGSLQNMECAFRNLQELGKHPGYKDICTKVLNDQDLHINKNNIFI